MDVCEPPFIGQLSRDKRVTKHICSKANEFCLYLAPLSDAVVVWTILPGVELQVTTRVGIMEHTMVERVQSLERQIKNNADCINEGRTMKPDFNELDRRRPTTAKRK